MSGVVLNAVELLNPTTSGSDDRSKALADSLCKIGITDDTATIHAVSIPTILKQSNNLYCLTPAKTTNDYPKRLTAKNSIDNNNIYIVTSDESDSESSVLDSDVDVNDVIKCNDERVLANKTIDPPSACRSSVLYTNDGVKPNIGSIAVQNSSDITFGNKTFYQAPVTINHYVYDKNKERESEPQENSKESQKSKIPKFVNSIQEKVKCSKKRVLVSAISAGVLIFLLLVIILVVIFTSSDEKSSGRSVGRSKTMIVQ